MSQPLTTTLVSASAIAFAVLGVLFLFAPAETAVVLGAPAMATPFLQLLGGAYFGFAAAD